MHGLELKKETAQDLVTNLIGFLKHETFVWGNSVSYFISFLYKNAHLFSKENLENILRGIPRKINIYKNVELIDLISHIFKKNSISGISDRSLIFKLLSDFETNDKKSKVIVPLWSISDDEIKKELKNQICDKLDKEFDVDLYTKASFAEIIDFNKYFEKFIAQIDKTKGGNYTLQHGKPAMQSFVFINAIIFIYHMKVNSDDKRLQAFTNLSDYMQFYLFPEKFDYQNFKVEWLLIAPREVFFERFKGISAIKKEIQKALKEKFDIELAEIFIKYFI